jgi:hypothetical protein
MYAEMSPASGAGMAGSQGAFGGKDWYRQANPRMHIRAEPVTGANARYSLGFSDCSVATIQGSDNPTCTNAYLLASTTTGTHNWYCVVGDGTTSAATDTGIPWTAGTAYELDVQLTPSNVACSVNGAATTVTTKLPPTSNGMYGGYVVVVATSGSATTTLRWSRLYVQSDN